jgi:hypothetical protein
MDEVCALAVDWVRTNLPAQPTDGFDLDYLEKLGRAAQINDCATTLQTMRRDGCFNSAILQAFVLGQLLMDDSFKPLVAKWEAFRRGGRKSGSTEARETEMAREFQQLSKASRLSPSALMEKIGKKHDLGRTQSIDAINSGLKKLSGKSV